MGMDGDPKARYANAAMTGYPSNEHVYSLPLRLGEYDAAQLIYALARIIRECTRQRPRWPQRAQG